MKEFWKEFWYQVACVLAFILGHASTPDREKWMKEWDV